MKKFLFISPLIVFLAASCGTQTDKTANIQKQATQQQTNNFDLQAKCADMSAKYFSNKGYKNDDGYTYENHFNLKQNKCFILIKSYNINDDFIAIDLYDALEGKRYGSYNGHNLCDTVSLSIFKNLKKCQFDSGDIWLDGNDAKKPADYHVGFQGITVGPGIGDENTQKLFIEKIQPFMND